MPRKQKLASLTLKNALQFTSEKMCCIDGVNVIADIDNDIGSACKQL